MPSRGSTSIEKFDGVALDIHRAKLPDGLFQEDSGGDRSNRGSWRVRRGLVHTTVPKQSGPVVTLVGFNLPGATTALTVVTVTGGTATGVPDVGTQPQVVTTGFGSGGFGSGGFGG